MTRLDPEQNNRLVGAKQLEATVTASMVAAAKISNTAIRAEVKRDTGAPSPLSMVFLRISSGHGTT
jgi:hypothetical protein